jgi:hypothetical protein
MISFTAVTVVNKSARARLGSPAAVLKLVVGITTPVGNAMFVVPF